MRREARASGVAVAIGVALAASASGAWAATASWESKPGDGDPRVPANPVTTVRFSADPGELNQLTVGLFDDRVVFGDSAAPIRTTGSGCRAEAGSTAGCERPSEPLDVRLGDGDDRAVIDSGGLSAIDDSSRLGLAIDLQGEAGADTLIGAKTSHDAGATLDGGADGDSLVGSDAADLSIGGTGADTVVGGAGDDVIVDSSGDPERSAMDTTDRDSYDGGPGNDTVVYAGRGAPMRVTLGEGGTEDRLVSIESLQSGRGNDVLVGNGGSNTLIGGRGADRLVGRAGNDGLDAGSDRTPDVLRCGRGRDAVWGTRIRDLVSTDCERVDLGGSPFEDVSMLGGPRRRGRTVRVRLSYFLQGDLRVPRPRAVRLFRGKRLLGTGSRPPRNRESASREGTSVVRLNRAGRRLASRGSFITLRYGRVGLRTKVR